jgi:Phage Tail Collar Domain/Collagen triple helix repeat (20 copies)
MGNLKLAVAVGVALVMAAAGARSGPVTVPNTFVPGTPARAADVNANFAAVAGAVNGSAADIVTLQTTIQALQKAQAALGFTFKGPWASSAAYSSQDVVSEGGSSYIALTTSTAVDPAGDVGGNGGHWAVLAAAGTAGAGGATGPQGLTGAVGPIGPRGPAGASGATGPAGPIGPAGPQGQTGATGATGAAGPAGPAGPVGLTGPTGATGPSGAMGPAGPVGPTGATGLTGATGPTGAQGPPGTIPSNLTALSGQLGTSGYAGENAASSVTCMLGDIVLSVASYGNGGSYAPADGRLLPLQSNTALFSILGKTFGGDGFATFALPDLRAFAPAGLQYSVCVNGPFPGQN